MNHKGDQGQYKSSHDSFIEGIINLEDYHPTLLNKINNAKQKLDEVDELNGNAVLDQQFINTHKQLLKSITWDFQILHGVLQKLQKDNMNQYINQRIVIINTIKQQIKRFKAIIPPQINMRVTASRIRNNQVFKSNIKIPKESQESQNPSENQDDKLFGSLNQCFKQYIDDSEKKIKEKQIEDQILAREMRKKEIQEENVRKKLIKFGVLFVILFFILAFMVLRKSINQMFGH